jgi:hypothetical protein
MKKPKKEQSDIEKILLDNISSIECNIRKSIQMKEALLKIKELAEYSQNLYECSRTENYDLILEYVEEGLEGE